MEFVPVLAMAALVVAIINFIKFIKAGDGNGIATQLAVWVAGVVVLFIAAQTDFASGISIGDMEIDQMNAWTLVFVGLTLGSVGTLANDIKKALDNSDSAVKPPLISKD